jgi:hypothetical protein
MDRIARPRLLSDVVFRTDLDVIRSQPSISRAGVRSPAPGRETDHGFGSLSSRASVGRAKAFSGGATNRGSPSVPLPIGSPVIPSFSLQCQKVHVVASRAPPTGT